jgi:hypothetical protein
MKRPTLNNQDFINRGFTAKKSFQNTKSGGKAGGLLASALVSR